MATDRFTVSYEPDAVDPDAMFAAIRALGYRPSLAESAIPPQAAGSNTTPTVVPTLVQQAVDDATAKGKHVLLDFRAEWCGACRTMERTTLADPEVVRTLQEDFVVVPVDTDEHPEIGQRFGIVGLPTLIAFDGHGQIVFRHTGPIEARALVGALAGIASG